jgi:hypothetical protein
MGRRQCILIANLIIIIGSLVNTFANSIGMWCSGNLLFSLLVVDVSVDHGLQAVPLWVLESVL